MRKLLCALALSLTASLSSPLTATSAQAAACGNDASGFEAWIAAFKQEAPSQYGLKSYTVANALEGVTYDTQVIKLDRGQKSFKLSFEEFYKRRVNKALIDRGRMMHAQYAGMFERIQQDFGVPPQIIIAIWGLETGYGANSGKMDVVRSLATLSYDCRRSEFFTRELVSALTIIENGDKVREDMRGAWAGELGQTQFLASSYLNYAVDYDRDGKRDLIRSIPDVAASTANYLKQKGWRAGESWAPGTPNHEVLKEWNKAEVYVQTIGVMAEKLVE